MQHIISLAELIKFKEEEAVIYASSHKSEGSKQLKIDFKGGYEVWHNKTKIMTTKQSSEAIEKYNSLP